MRGFDLWPKVLTSFSFRPAKSIKRETHTSIALTATEEQRQTNINGPESFPPFRPSLINSLHCIAPVRPNHFGIFLNMGGGGGVALS